MHHRHRGEFSHLKWTWAIVLGYALSIWVHSLINMDGGPPLPIPGQAPKAAAYAPASAGDSAAADAVPAPTLSGEATKPEIGGVKRATTPP